jgi:hypothetical protein
MKIGNKYERDITHAFYGKIKITKKSSASDEGI